VSTPRRILTIDAVALQAPAAALGLLAPGEVIGCGGVWRAGSTGERESLEIFFLRDGLLVASVAGPHLAAGELPPLCANTLTCAGLKV